jgi:hypothetical protein
MRAWQQRYGQPVWNTTSGCSPVNLEELGSRERTGTIDRIVNLLLGGRCQPALRGSAVRL